MEPLTTEFMKQYDGCQVEIITGNGISDPRWRCQVKSLEVRGEGKEATLHAEFDYCMAGALGQPWVKEEPTKPSSLSLAICSWNPIGKGRFAINSPILGEMWVFYPKDHPTKLLADGTFINEGD